MAELAAERKFLDSERINADDLGRTLAEFDAVWSSLTTKEQEQLIQLLVAKVGYDGRTGKVMPNKNSVVVLTPQSEDRAVQVEVTISLRSSGHKAREARIAPVAGTPEPRRIPRITRLMALAIKFQGMVDRGEVRDYADLARLGYVTRARLTQIMNLLLLDPKIQEWVLSAEKRGKLPITERDIRAVVAKPHWQDQQIYPQLVAFGTAAKAKIRDGDNPSTWICTRDARSQPAEVNPSHKNSRLW